MWTMCCTIVTICICLNVIELSNVRRLRNNTSCNKTRRSSCSITEEESRKEFVMEDRKKWRGKRGQNGDKGKYERRLSAKWYFGNRESFTRFYSITLHQIIPIVVTLNSIIMEHHILLRPDHLNCHSPVRELLWVNQI